MKKLQLEHPIILERISKCFVGDENSKVPFPYRSGSELVRFFNEFGYSDIYGSGFATRWVYANEKIKELLKNNRFEEFLNKALSIDELLSLNKDIEDLDAFQMEILNSLNKYIFSLTDFIIDIKSGMLKLCKQERLKRIGGGYFAEVFLLEEDNNKYAIKKLKESFKSNREYAHRFRREYEMMEKFNKCEYTITVLGYDETDYSFKMEYAECSLKEYIEKNFHLMNMEWKEDLAEKIILGMFELHKSTIHRDLSYNNILLVNNNPKLADFGLGKEIDKLYSYKTVSESNIGTPHFTDPLQHLNINNACEQTDIYGPYPICRTQLS